MAKTLIEVLEENNIELLDSGSGRRVAICPFHKGDRDPSFTIYPNDTYFCFGCEVWGDAVKFLVDFKKMSTTEAMEYIGIDYRIPRADKNKVIKLKNAVKTWRFLYSVAEQYHEHLKQTPGALGYLYKRGLTDATIEKYKLGYTDGRVLNISFAEEYALGTEIGLLTKDGFEALSHRVTIPNFLDRGECDFIIGRTVLNDKMRYLGLRVPKPLHGFYEIRQSPIIFLAEGQFDWLILRQWGFPAAVLGGSHLTTHSQNLLKSKNVVVVPDNDDVGHKSAQALKATFPGTIILDYSKFGTKDIAEFALQDSARENFIQLVKEQVPWISSISTKTLNLWFPNLIKELLSP